MCLAIPGRIREIEVDADGLRTATVDYPGLSKSVSLLYLPEAQVGDPVLVQAGFAIRRLTEEQAAEVLAALASPAAAALVPTTSPVGGAP
jgi:hydrogenase expression/formation protein HypC